MTKITLIQRRQVEFLGQDGQLIEGFMYAGFMPDGKPVEFFSKNPNHKVVMSTGFSENASASVNLVAKVFQGKVKFSEPDLDTKEA